MIVFEKNINGLVDLLQHYIREYRLLDPVEFIKEKEQIETFKERQMELSKNLKTASYADPSIRSYVKMFIENVLTDPKSRIASIKFSNTYESLKDDFKISPVNIDEFIRYQPQMMDAEMKFRILLEQFKLESHEDALVQMIKTFGWANKKLDKTGEWTTFVDKDDIENAFNTTKVVIDYKMKLNILVQLVYEATYGNRKVDELLYQRTIEGLSVGVYGLPKGMTADGFKNVKLYRDYDAVSVTYMDDSIRLEFMSFLSEDGLEDVVRRLIRSENGISMNTENPKYEGDRQGSDRIVAAQPPFSKTYMAFIRIHGRAQYSVEDLVLGVAAPVPPKTPPKGHELILDALKLIMRGMQNLMITGPQNTGKTSILRGLVKYYDPNLRIGTNEAMFEAQLRRMYPLRNIAPFRETENLDMKRGYEFSLRAERQIALLPEITQDEVFAQIITTGNRGVYCCCFTSHQKTAEEGVIETANSLLTSGIYKSLNEAIRAVLATLSFCLELRIDRVTKFRYYNLYEYRPIAKRLANFRNTEHDPLLTLFESYALNILEQDAAYETVPIVKFNIDTWQYEKVNNFSSKEVENLFYNMSNLEDRALLKRFTEGCDDEGAA